MSLLAGLAAAILIWWLLKFFAGSNPARVARVARTIGGVAALGGAGLLAFRGRIDMAFLLGSGGAWLLGWNVPGTRFFSARPAARRPGSVSRVRSARIEMELDHDTGATTGRVTAGAGSGRPLDSFTEAELVALRAVCLVEDPEGARLVEAYLDRRNPGWREHAEPDPDPGSRTDPKLGAMSEQEAYEVLGLQPGSAETAVRAAHRDLMKKLHPDHGGSTYLASRVNQAKDVLLNRHR